MRTATRKRSGAAATTWSSCERPAPKCCRRTPAAAGAAGGKRRDGGGKRIFLPRADRGPRRQADPASRRAPRQGMSAELGPAVIAFVVLACLLAGFGHGALGFGFPIVATPLVALAIDIRSAIALLAPITLVLTVISALRGVALSSIVREFRSLPLATALGA